MSPRIGFKRDVIASTRDIKTGIAGLRRACPILTSVHDRTGDPPVRRWQSGFPGLARIVVGQQLSTASADAILGRLLIAVDPLDPAGLLAASDQTLRTAGLSAGKVATLRAIATAIIDGALNPARFPRASDEHIHGQLTAIRGVGPWTADIYLLFCLGRADAFAPGDLALQVAVENAYNLSARPSPAALLGIAERWRPWRGVAARLLWADYAHHRNRTPRPDV
jgi:DNA-3-methyladenine glycosylase II